RPAGPPPARAAPSPVVLRTPAGRRSLHRRTLDVARPRGAASPARLRTGGRPGVRPRSGTSCRVALGIGWVVLVPAEMFGVTNGLGYAVLNARDNMDYSALAATMLLIGAVGYLLDVIAQQIARQD